MIKKKIVKASLIILSLILTGLIFTVGITTLWIVTLEVPDIGFLPDVKVAQSTKIYDRTGKIILWDIHEDVQRTVVPMSAISRHIKNATVAVEDSSFYQHKGVDFVGIIRATFKNILAGKLSQGGSTISQQLVKKTLLTDKKTFSRKIKEFILTIKIEKILTKDQILEKYLNQIPYGGSNYGVESASKSFFGKSASDIGLAEAAYLASVIKAPTYYSPYGNHVDELEKRKNFALDKMAELGFITNEEKEKTKNEKVVFINKGQNTLKAAHFSIYIRSYLEEKYGKDMVEQGGLKVITTLDYSLQQKAEEIATKYAKENTEKFNATNNSIVAIDPKTGQILAMVGSKDYFDKEGQGNFNVALAKRQPGSAIKPFIYATAFKKGYTPETVLFDLQTEFNSSCNPDGTSINASSTNNSSSVSPEDACYMPKNYDNKYRGPVNMREALAQSLNVPSVKTLYLAGIQESLNTLRDTGITSLIDPKRYGLTLVLGGGEVSLLELTGAYSVFANSGAKNKPIGIIKVEDGRGKILEEFTENSQQVLDKNISILISNILSDNKARAPAFGEYSPLYFPQRPVAVKTGTTNDYKDAWVIGYTPNIAVGAWAGNNNNAPMEKMVAGFIVAPLWHELMEEIFKTLPNENFERPVKITPKENSDLSMSRLVLSGEWRGGQTYLIDSVSQKLATEFTPPELTQEKVLTQVHSILYWLNKDDPSGPKPEHPEQDPQFELWETPIRKWAEENGIKDQEEKDIPKETDNVHKPEYMPKLKIESPEKEKIYNLDEIIPIKFSIESKFGLKQVDFFFNNGYLGSANKEPFNFSFMPNEGKINSFNDQEIKIIAYDKMGNKSETIIIIKLNLL